MKSFTIVGFVLMVIAGCSDGDEVLDTTTLPEPTQVVAPTPTTDTGQGGLVEIADLLAGAGEREAIVRGFVVWNEASARLCEVMAESFPPQCGGQSIVIANPDSLAVVFETEGTVSWTQGFVAIEGFFDGDQFIVNKDPGDGDGNGDTTSADEPSIEDQALADAFLGFVADPSVRRLAQLNLAETVVLGLGDEIAKTLPADALLDPLNWTIDRDEFRAWSGPFSALWLAEPPVVLTLGEHPRCAADPVPAPPGMADHRRVSLQPEAATSCLEWWTVDFFLESAGKIEAITLDLFAP